MLNKLWLALLLSGLAFGLLTGRSAALSAALLQGGNEAISVVLSMAGALALWSGLMAVAQGAGLIKKLEAALLPLLHRLFPELGRHHKALPHIALNFTANALGLGWAATPAGLKAMEELQKGRPAGADKTAASRSMCTFLLLNISSVQLVNLTVSAWRAQYGSADPTWAMLPSLAATALTTLTALLLCRLLGRGKE